MLRAFKRHKTLGLMTKITDEDAGSVEIDGTIHKPGTENDRKKLDAGEKNFRRDFVAGWCKPKIAL